MKYIAKYGHEFLIVVAAIWAAIGTSGQQGLVNLMATEVNKHPNWTVLIGAASVLIARYRIAPNAKVNFGKAAIALAFLFLATSMNAQTSSGYQFSISGGYAASNGNATNNGMQNTSEWSFTQHAPRGWGARVDLFGLNNPSGATLSLAEGQYKTQAATLFKTTNPTFKNIDLSLHAGFGVLKSSTGAASFAAGTGVSVDYNVTSFAFVRVLDLTYAYSRGLGNNGIILGNYVSAGSGFGFRF